MNSREIHRVIFNVPILWRWIAVWLAAFSVSTNRGDEFSSEIRPLLDKYCVKCHGPNRPKGGVNLDRFKSMQSIHLEAGLWETVARQVSDRLMPPENKPQPTGEEFQKLAEWLRDTLENPDPAFIARDPGAKRIHRLSRVEYNNTLRDLLGIDLRPANSFPADGGGGGGFDNQAETLFVPPILMERYLETADRLVGTAGFETMFPIPRKWYLGEQTWAEQNLRQFLKRAYRRPPEDEEVALALRLHSQSRASGSDAAMALRTVAKSTLVSPQFLFRVEQDPSGPDPARIGPYELAARLSYFLWSSMPDDLLMHAADSGRLMTPSGLEAEIRRMLASPKLRALAEEFAGQWLGVPRFLESSGPEKSLFPHYTLAVRDAMAVEPSETFLSLLREGNPILDLVDSKFVCVNEPLARHYGISNVAGLAFRKVTAPDPSRGGVLGMGAVLVQTSYPRRTSPVLRGKWILEEILGTPPPPPPPMVATLPQDDRNHEGLSFRQRLEKHRSNPNCSACHQRMDPLGFSMENYDASGKWRTEIDGRPVDTNGVLPSGTRVDGPAALKAAIVVRKDLFLRHLTGQMLSYALGRGLENFDRPVILQITQKLDGGAAGIQVLISEIVRSYPFQFRRAQSREDSANEKNL